MHRILVKVIRGHPHHLGRLAAREAGHSWDRIGQALDMRPVDGRTVAEAAFERFAGRPGEWALSGPSFTWRCPACGRVISDLGPYESHPDDNQPGHASGCTRLAAELERWRASWDNPAFAPYEQGSGR